MGLPLLAMGISTGMNLLGTGLGILAERKRRERFSQELRAEAMKKEAVARQHEFAPSESLGRMEAGATRRTLSSLSRRGVLDSSMSAPAIAETVAPFEQARQEQYGEAQDEASDLRMAAAAVQSGAPGMEDFLGGALGDFGSLVALKAGFDVSQGDQIDVPDWQAEQSAYQAHQGRVNKRKGEFDDEQFAESTYIPAV